MKFPHEWKPGRKRRVKDIEKLKKLGREFASIYEEVGTEEFLSKWIGPLILEAYKIGRDSVPPKDE